MTTLFCSFFFSFFCRRSCSYNHAKLLLTFVVVQLRLLLSPTFGATRCFASSSCRSVESIVLVTHCSLLTNLEKDSELICLKVANGPKKSVFLTELLLPLPACHIFRIAICKSWCERCYRRLLFLNTQGQAALALKVLIYCL
jgi:hypothetical protein